MERAFETQDLPEQDVVVTGFGMITPLGATAPESWNNLLAGHTAGQWLSFPECSPAVDWAGCPARWPENVEATSPERLHRLALLAAQEAVHDAGGLAHVSPTRRACVIGTSKVDVAPLVGQQHSAAWYFPSFSAATLAQIWDCQAAALCPVAACATGLVSILRGADLIREGLADVVLAGGVDASLHPTLLASYQRLGVLAKITGNPAHACRPFDANRNGFLVGEGGAVLILERRDVALQRQAKIYGALRGGLLRNDPSGLTAVDGTGGALAQAILSLLSRLEVDYTDIDALSLHGTATRLNDLAEGRALHRVFGKHLDSLPIFSTKGATGHLMGGAGAVESAFALLSLQHRTVPPTANHFSPDPECRIRLTSQSEVFSGTQILKISLGFGGHIAVALFQS